MDATNMTGMMKYDLVVLGGGESGVGAAILASTKGLSVFLSELGNLSPRYREELEHLGIPFEEGRHTEGLIFQAREVVKSPGIPEKAPLVKALREQGTPVISEIEFAGRYTRAFIIGITGTNGKTTTTRLLFHLLHTAGLDVVMAGNVGNSFAREVALEEHQYYVLELSSFQLDGIDAFRCNIALLLNITPDHLDRYDYQMGNYVAAKFRITRNQQPDDRFLFNGDDPVVREGLTRHPFAASPVPVHVAGQDDFSRVVLDGREYSLDKGPLRGRHNLSNATFAVQTATLMGLEPAIIQHGLDTFENAPHRLEQVAEINGVDYINDSKATNIDSAYYALEAMTRPVVWIAGGTDKGNDYSTLEPFVRQKVRALVCLGADNSKLLQAFQGKIPSIAEAKSAVEAVEKSYELANPGDVVLLSPACASFDLFRNYEDRGEKFKTAVRELAAKHPQN